MNRIKKVKVKLTSLNLFLIILISLFSIFEIYLLISGKIRIFFFSFFIFFGFSIIIYNRNAGIFYILTYILFMPFLRRIILLFENYQPIELLYLVPDILILFFFTYVFIPNIDNFKKILKYHEFKILFFLQIIMFLEIFNPLQGPILVGFGGAKFLLIPSLLAYLPFITEENSTEKLKRFIIIAGLISLVYAIIQINTGYFHFEKKWLHSVRKEYLSIFAVIGQHVRPFSFFSSVGEFGQFMGISALISLFFVRHKLKIILFLIFLYGIIISGIRSSIYALFITSIFILIYKKSRNLRNFSKLSFVIFFLWVIIINLVNLPNSINLFSYSGRFLQGIFDPLRKGSSLHPRLEAWRYILYTTFTKKPFGSGLGVATRAAVRFKGYNTIADSTFFAMFSACGIAGGLLLFYLLFSILIKSIKAEDKIKNTVLLPLSLIISISVGQLLVQYLIGALFWISVGLWIKNFYKDKEAIH